MPLAPRGWKVGWEMRLIAQARRPHGVANCDAAACSSGPPTSPAWLLTCLHRNLDQLGHGHLTARFRASIATPSVAPQSDWG